MQTNDTERFTKPPVTAVSIPIQSRGIQQEAFPVRKQNLKNRLRILCIRAIGQISANVIGIRTRTLFVAGEEYEGNLSRELGDGGNRVNMLKH